MVHTNIKNSFYFTFLCWHGAAKYVWAIYLIDYNTFTCKDAEKHLTNMANEAEIKVIASYLRGDDKAAHLIWNGINVDLSNYDWKKCFATKSYI